MQQFNQDALLREIDEDLQRERWSRLWKRWRVVILGLAAAGLVAVAAVSWWRNHQSARIAADAVHFLDAVDMIDRDRPAALAEFRALGRDGTSGYALLSRFREAALNGAAGDHAAAQDVLAAVAGGGEEQVYRDLALIIATAERLDAPAGLIDAADIESRLAPATAADRPLRPLAQEVIAAAWLMTGNIPRAREVLTQLAADPQTPPTSRSLAAELLAALEVQ